MHQEPCVLRQPCRRHNNRLLRQQWHPSNLSRLLVLVQLEGCWGQQDMVVDYKRLAGGIGLKEQRVRGLALGLGGILLGRMVEIVDSQHRIGAVDHVGSPQLMEDHSRPELVHHM